MELSLASHELKNVWSRTKEIFSGVLSVFGDAVEKVNISEIGITLRSGLNRGNWRDRGNELFQILASAEKPILLLMDEVPLMINRMLKGDEFAITPERRAAVDEFMSWLRDISIRHQGRIHIIMSGSIGFEPVLHQAGLSAAINNFWPFQLKPWDQETTLACLRALSNEYGIEFETGAAMEIVARLGCCIPHHVQTFFAHVYERCRRGKCARASVDDVREVYENEMLGIRGHAELTHYEERLKLVLGPDTFPLALEMLTEAAVVGQVSRETLAFLQNTYDFGARKPESVQEEILRVLEHDGYLKNTENGYSFESRLLRDWWKKRYGFFYTPVGKRGVVK